MVGNVEPEWSEHIADGDGYAAAWRFCGLRQRQELPDAVGVSLAPRAVGYEAQVDPSVA